MPALERRMTFVTGATYDTTHPWEIPRGTDEVTLTTADGIHLNGWFTTGAAPRNGVTVLFLHGNTQSVFSLARDLAFLQQRGFDAFAVDYRGYGKSEGQSSSEATLRLDGNAALNYLTQQRHIDPATIALFGQSLGTTVAADLAVTSPCRSLVLMAPLASARQQARAIFPHLPAFLYWFMHSPLDIVGKIGRAHCPVMVVHGDDDGVIGLAQGVAVYEAARSPKKLVVVPNGGHVPSITQGGFYVEDVVSFLAQPSR